MIAQIPPEIINAIPSKWLVYINAAGVLFVLLRPVIHSLINSGGLRGAWNALVYGKTVHVDNGTGAAVNVPQTKTNT